MCVIPIRVRHSTQARLRTRACVARIRMHAKAAMSAHGRFACVVRMLARAVLLAYACMLLQLCPRTRGLLAWRAVSAHTVLLACACTHIAALSYARISSHACARVRAQAWAHTHARARKSCGARTWFRRRYGRSKCARIDMRTYAQATMCANACGH